MIGSGNATIPSLRADEERPRTDEHGPAIETSDSHSEHTPNRTREATVESMTRRSTIATAMAVLCVVAVGVSATTLDSAVRTNPDEVIDLDWDRLPIGEAAAAELKTEMRENEGSVVTETAGTTGEPEVQQRQRAGSGDRTIQRSGGLVDPEQSTARQRGRTQPPEEVEQSTGTGVPDRPPWDLLRLAAAIALLAALIAIGYRYRDRFGSGAASTESGDAPPPWPPDGPTTEVDRAWLAMVGRLDLDRPWTRTPAEVAEAAVEAGLDPETVEQVTAAFEDVRYGGSPVTSARSERARGWRRRFDPGAEGGAQ